ncbi:hypothetical protein BGX27_007299 [Mortierella sp. AM989]|nr:hypothetical protein BGX27_007299 [Mortierella sp. AM989]
MVPEPQRHLTINTTIEKIHIHQHRHTSQSTEESNNDMSESMEYEYHRGHAESRSVDNLVSATDLANKLEKLKEEQDKYTAMCEHHRHRSHHASVGTVQINKDLQRRAQDTVQEILERLEHQRNGSDSSSHNAVPGVENNGDGRMRHINRVNPDLLKDTIYGHSLRQSHGNANLRHS